MYNLGNPYGRQSQESEKDRNISFAQWLVALRAILAFLLFFECVMIGRGCGPVMVAVAVIIWVVWHNETGEYLPRLVPWAEPFYYLFVFGVSATIIWAAGWWPIVHWEVDETNMARLINDVTGVISFNLQMWQRFSLIIAAPLIAYVPWIILDWVVRMEMEKPNVRNATPEHLSISGIHAPTTGEFEGVRNSSDPPLDFDDGVDDPHYTARDIGSPVINSDPGDVIL